MRIGDRRRSAEPLYGLLDKYGVPVLGLFRSKEDRGVVFTLIKRILRENGREYRGRYIFAGLCMLALAATTAFQPLLVQKLIDDVFFKLGYSYIAPLCIAIIVVFIIRGAASYGQSVTMAYIGNNLIARYQARLFNHLMRLGVGFYNDRRSGALAAQLNENIMSIRDLIGQTLTALVRDAATVVALLGVMIYTDPKLFLITFLVGPPLVLGVSYLGRRVRKLSRQSIVVNSRLVGAMQETTQGIAVVKAYTMEDQLAAKMDGLITEVEGRSNKIAAVTERLGPITESLAGFAIAGVIAYSGYVMQSQGTPPGNLVAFIMAFFLAYDPVKKLSRLQVNLERSMVNAKMIYEILDQEPPQRDAPGASELKIGAGEVEFDKVSFAYTDDTPVLNEVSILARAGETTAIVGASGAGKSTLFALVERFYDVGSGQIRIDGQDIAHVTKNSLRGQIAYVSQQPYMFEGTIRDNIRYGRASATDAEIEAAARLANAEEFILRQPDGYETPVGENGATLSGGQRQRLSIARAIVRNAPILLLDEATSALDNESEAKVQAALTEVMKGRTTLVIAHRLSTVIGADRIVVMEAGRVVEQGTHKELLRDANGVYARFYRLQADKSSDLIEEQTPQFLAVMPAAEKPKRTRKAR